LHFFIEAGLRGWQFGGVPRKLRVEYAGAIYHVINCGDRREEIFRDDLDRRCFLVVYQFEIGNL